MKATNSEIRARARQALDNNIFSNSWLMSLLVLVIMSLILSAVSGMSCGIGAYLLVGPINIGLAIAFLKLVRGEGKMEISTAFEGLNDFGSNLMVGLMTTIYISLWTLLFIIPGIIKSYSYTLVYCIKADHPEYGWRQCLSESEEMMKGNKMRFFSLQLSFIGWIFLSIFTCGISSLWVNAYMQTANVVFYEEVKNEYLTRNGTYYAEQPDAPDTNEF